MLLLLANPDLSKLSTMPPVRPRGGSMYLYRCPDYETRRKCKMATLSFTGGSFIPVITFQMTCALTSTSGCSREQRKCRKRIPWSNAFTCTFERRNRSRTCPRGRRRWAKNSSLRYSLSYSNYVSDLHQVRRAFQEVRVRTDQR